MVCRIPIPVIGAIAIMSVLVPLTTAHADTFTWTPQSPTNPPTARVFHGKSYDAAHGQVVLFGGFDSSYAVLGDTWTWDGNNWTQRSPSTSPAARALPGMAYDAAYGHVVLFGGAATAAAFGDTWTWESCIAPITTQPQSQTIGSGMSAFLTVATQGRVIAYQWYQGASGDTSNPISAATHD